MKNNKIKINSRLKNSAPLFIEDDSDCYLIDRYVHYQSTLIKEI